MSARTEWDDDLARTETRDEALERGKALARERAEADAPANYCAICVDDTPLAYNNASDAATVRFVRDLTDAVAEQIRAVNGPLTDAWWVRDALTEQYRDAYFEACPSETDCSICAHPENYPECGHLRIGDECPARSGGRA